VKRLLQLSGLAFVIYLSWWPWYRPLRRQNPTRPAIMLLREREARARGTTPHSLLLWRPLTHFPPALIQALLSSEDDRFFHHGGFDFGHIKIALAEDWKQKRFVLGGSTLTQQLARTLYLSPRKNIFRKAKEAVITVWLERTLTKPRLLEIYLNVVEWGRDIYGAEAAARHYYHKSAAELSVDEAVALVAILPSPRRWSPHSERAFMAKQRMDILEQMRDDSSSL